MASQYRYVNFNMLYVEFQHVDTSQGIMRTDNGFLLDWVAAAAMASSSRIAFYQGRRMVVDLLIT